MVGFFDRTNEKIVNVNNTEDKALRAKWLWHSLSFNHYTQRRWSSNYYSEVLIVRKRVALATPPWWSKSTSSGPFSSSVLVLLSNSTTAQFYTDWLHGRVEWHWFTDKSATLWPYDKHMLSFRSITKQWLWFMLIMAPGLLHGDTVHLIH